MARFDKYGVFDDTPSRMGDRGFIGVNMRLDPAQLPPGYVSNAVNARFRNGVAETRKGIVVVPWANKLVSGTIRPWGAVYGHGVFRDPFSLQEYLLIAADGNVYYSTQWNNGIALSMPSGVTITTNVNFTQAFDVVVMHRGVSETTLQMPRISVGFQSVSMTGSGNGTQPIPNARRSIYFQNRLMIPKDNDEIAVSDNGDYTRYVPVLQEFKVNPGTSDDLVNIFRFNDTTLVAFKEHSIYVVSNVFGDMSEARLDEITVQFGLVAERSIAHVGNDLWFLSELGVMSISQTEQNKLQSVVLPVSDPIQPLIDRINWRYAENAVAAYWDNKYYLAVPLDDAESLRDELLAVGERYIPSTDLVVQVVSGATYRWVKGDNEVNLINGATTYTNSTDFVAAGSTVTVTGTSTSDVITASLKRVFKGVNNAVLVYDFLNGAWSGYDEGEGIEVLDFFTFTYNHRRRLFFFNPEGYVLLYEEDMEDALTVPYADVTIGTLANGNTVSVNGGTTITVTTGSGINSGANWGCITALAAESNLWTDSDGLGGYATYASARWTCPNATPVKIAGGVRFLSTNGVVPAVTQSAASVTVALHVTRPITFTLETRGYLTEGLDLNDAQYCYVDMQTWWPSYTLSALTGGVNESQALATAQTKNRLKYYYPADAADFDGTNVSGRFNEPYREDYSVALGAGGTPELLLGDGVAFDLHQETRETHRVGMNGRATRLKIVNTQGRMRVLSCMVEADMKQLAAGSAA